MTIENDGAVAPETVTSADVVQDAPAVTPEAPATSTDDPSAPPKKDKGVGKRINELVREREEARRQAEHWREQALRATGTTPRQDKTEVAQGKPESSEFESYDAYLDAVTEWKVEQRFKTERERFQKESSEREKQQRQREAFSNFEERANKAREKYEDFDAVITSRFPVTEAMTEALLESDSGPEIIYYLGNNPQEAARIAKLSPYAAAREIGKLEAKLPELTKATSAAPAPITPVKPKSQASESPSESDDMKTWLSKRNKQLGRK
jgi:signal recognition particle GTPase